MAKSRNRLFAELLTSAYAGEGSEAPEASVGVFETTVAGDGNTAIDSVSSSTVAAVTYHVVASYNGAYQYSTIAAVKNNEGGMDYNEYGVLETNDSALAAYSVVINNGNITLYADPINSSTKFRSTRIVVEE